MEPDEELQRLKRELTVYLRYDINLPLPDHAILELLSIIRRTSAHNSLEKWKHSLISMGIVCLGNRMRPTQSGALTAAQSEALFALNEYSTSSIPDIAGAAAHSLGMLKRREGIPAILRVIENDSFVDDQSHLITVRGIAFRALLRIEPQLAREAIRARARQEYLWASKTGDVQPPQIFSVNWTKSLLCSMRGWS
ncbi:hypothetical protein [Anatilimnocola floriformis]|uniref:hypothetical protein n=1 Tax=Anatilimnocola floriformis TaxID=2948575 RepID=UPI0020C33DDC|nr:hypothetical protein [Anatilimnocola floriformis]